MEEYGFIQSCRNRNYHDDIILRNPTLSTGERMLSMCFKNSKENSRILEFDYPESEKDIQEIMKDLHWNAERNVLAIQKVRSLNGLFGLQRYGSNADLTQDEVLQLWRTRTINSCNLVEMPQSIPHLLFAGEIRIFNFVESMNPLNIRKEMENCLPSAFQFWAIPEIRRILDEKMMLLVYGGQLLEETNNEPTEQGFISILLVIVRLIEHFNECIHVGEDFSKDEFYDSQFEKLKNSTEDEQKSFLIQEFERILSEINCPTDYIMELFINDIMQTDYVIDKFPYRSRKNILVIYRGLLFLAERRLETFMNVTLFVQIIQKFWTDTLSEEIITCLIRAGMVLALTEIWKGFVQERDFSGNIDASMEKAKLVKSKKTKICKKKEAVIKAKRTVVKKSSKSSLIFASSPTKKSKIETTSKSLDNDLQSKVTQSMLSGKKTTPGILFQEHVESNSDDIIDSGSAFDSQRTISDNEMLIKSSHDLISENKAVEETVEFSANFPNDVDLEFTKSHSESNNSDTNLSDSDSDFVNSPALSKFKKGNLSAKKEKKGNLKRSGKKTPRSKFSLKDSNAANNLTNQNQKISANPFHQSFINDSKLAIDNINSINNSSSNTNIPISQSVSDGDVGTGKLNRNLRPRYHMDKLSEFLSNLI